MGKVCGKGACNTHGTPLMGIVGCMCVPAYKSKQNKKKSLFNLGKTDVLLEEGYT
jgi:hypothetical protein